MEQKLPIVPCFLEETGFIIEDVVTTLIKVFF